MANRADTNGVPAVPLCLCVGVTGHRDVIDSDHQLQSRLTGVLQLLYAATRNLQNTAGFAPQPMEARLICPLAAGADQMAAATALDLGYQLHALLPFNRTEYASDFARSDSAMVFETLLGRATRILELPCKRDEATSAYALAGRATVAHSDLLIAVWDGLPARGPGGTAEVVEDALRRGLPVIHVPVDPAQVVRLVWTAHEPHMRQTRVDEIASRTLQTVDYGVLVTRLLAPPQDKAELTHLDQFYRENERRLRLRIEYPLLLAVTGVARLRRSSFLSTPYIAADELVSGTPKSTTHNLFVWRNAFGWSDGLASHFAQSYRSGHVFNFLAGALAVVLGLSGLLLPTVKLWLAFAELAVIGAFILNTRIGVTRNWHRRWLDYRQLAERLRPMASLSAIGVAQPERQPAVRRAVSWVDWYAAGIWRHIGMPAGEMAGDIGALTTAMVAEEIAPQVAYNASSAAAVLRLDHRLHYIGTVLFVMSCLSCAAFIAAYLTDHAWTIQHAANFVALSAGLPAVGTALFGIRVQGDFAGTAARSAVTAEHLAAVVAALQSTPATLSRTADGMEAAARAMVADLGEWRLSHQQRQLELT